MRARYCKSINITLDTTTLRTDPQVLDLEEFRDSRLGLGKAANWAGEFQIYAKRTNKGRISVRVTLENAYDNRAYMEPGWFDVRMRIRHSRPLQETFCPLLDKDVPVQTINCVVASQVSLPDDTFEADKSIWLPDLAGSCGQG